MSEPAPSSEPNALEIFDVLPDERLACRVCGRRSCPSTRGCTGTGTRPAAAPDDGGFRQCGAESLVDKGF